MTEFPSKNYNELYRASKETKTTKIDWMENRFIRDELPQYHCRKCGGIFVFDGSGVEVPNYCPLCGRS